MRHSILLVLLLAACVRIEDSRSATDSSAALRPDTTPQPISDQSLRPGAEADPSTFVRGNPAAIIEALATDSMTTLTVIDSSPMLLPTESDLAVLKRSLIVPVAGITRDQLRDSYNEKRGGSRPHEAIDVLAPRGTPVLSAASGRVLKLFTSVAGGLMIYAADSSDRFILMYGHLDAYAPGLAEGQPLRQGQPIGTVGTTGNAPPGTPHLHFAIGRSSDTKVWYKAAPLNPYPLFVP